MAKRGPIQAREKHIETLKDYPLMIRSNVNHNVYVPRADVDRKSPPVSLSSALVTVLIKLGYVETQDSDTIRWTKKEWSSGETAIAPAPETLYPEWDDMTEDKRDDVALNEPVSGMTQADLIRVIERLRTRVAHKSSRLIKHSYAAEVAMLALQEAVEDDA